MESAETLRPPVDWEAVRVEYENSPDTVEQIAARFGVTRSALSWRAKTLFWAKRYRGRGMSRTQVIDRLFRLLERQIIQLESNMKDTGEKEVAVLGRLTATLEKLIEIDKAENEKKSGASPSQHQDMEELRNKIALRLAQLRQE
jgi:hypothetical protein